MVRCRARRHDAVQHPVPELDDEPFDRFDQSHDDMLRLPGSNRDLGVLQEPEGVTGQFRPGGALLFAGTGQALGTEGGGQAFQLGTRADKLLYYRFKSF
ncbi:hypothetical protein Scel_03740 [Streptomyces cellostaticus]|nr:hypothetical protein Scel_03740 [Streptomyces cellostaticus]